MYGLINRSFQNFICDTYGWDLWSGVVDRAAMPVPEFEPMRPYDDAVTDRVIDAAAAVLNKPRATVLEDAGNYLISHPNASSLRRLLRFGGVDFIEFLHSLDDLPDRARLAVPELEMPDLTLHEHMPGRFRLDVTSPYTFFGHVFLGLLRAMADDYGALVFIEYGSRHGMVEDMSIDVFETDFAQGRDFDLGAGSVGVRGQA